MLRMPLAELCLQIKLLSLGYVKPLLSKVGSAIFQLQIFNLMEWSNLFFFPSQ